MTALLTSLAVVALFSGAAVALLLRFLPPASPWWWVLPLLLTVSGLGSLLRRSGWRRALVILCGAWLAALLPALWIWSPDGDGAPVPSLARDDLIAVSIQVPAAFRHGPFSESRTLWAPPGFVVSVFAAGLGSPRMLAFSPRGDLFVSVPQRGQVLVLPDRDGDGVADRVVTFVSGLDRPHGLAFAGSDLVVAETGQLLALTDRDGDLHAEGRRILSNDLPGGGGHWTRSVVRAADGSYFVSAGSSCNACVEKDPRRAAILHLAPGGGKAVVYAHGLRNSVGLAFDSRGQLWASDNGRDLLGDDLPPEEINRIKAGGDYGWPYCYGDRVPDPDLGTARRCQDTLPPAVVMPAHSAPLGIAFGDGLAFPARYRSLLYVAFHGSWNRSVPTGYKLIAIPFAEGRPSGPPQDVVVGWLHDASAWGRPVAPAVGPDGALYLSDDRAGAVYRIVFRQDSS